MVYIHRSINGNDKASLNGLPGYAIEHMAKMAWSILQNTNKKKEKKKKIFQHGFLHIIWKGSFLLSQSSDMCIVEYVCVFCTSDSFDTKA